MSFFTNAQGVEVSGGQFIAMTTATTINSDLGPTGIDILREASAPEAMYDSSTRSYPPRCFPGTREQYIEDITHWAIPSIGDTPPPIFWMRGPAGVGKSAIAQTCAEKLQKIGALGASFFFSIGGHHKAGKFFPSIAYQLSIVHPAYRDLIDRKIRHDKTLICKAMQFQFQYLIDEPLRELEENGKGVRGRVQVFVDGLDECEGTNAQCEIIRIITTAVSDGVIPLRWAFFSRPEPHIEAMLSRTSVSSHCYKTILPISRDADREIELYLRNHFEYILQRHNTLTHTQWPSDEEMNIVVSAAGGSFIYATTVVRFVGHPDSLQPQKRLRVIIDAISERRSQVGTSTDAPFAELDAFYMLILQRVPTKIFPSIHLLLAIMCRYSWSAIMVANVLGLSKDEFRIACSHVNAIVHFEEPGKDLKVDPTTDTSYTYMQTSRNVLWELRPQIRRHLGGQVRFYHSSFRDFLLDPMRSGSYCVKVSEVLANLLVKTPLDYDRSFCWHGSELVFVPGVPDSAASLSYPHTTNLVNSILTAVVYASVGDEDPFSFSASRESESLNADRDFRKHLHIFTNLLGINYAYSRLLWGCESQRKEFPGTYIDYIPHNGFPKSIATEFKLVKIFALTYNSFILTANPKMIKRWEEANVIQRYYPNLASRIKPLFRNKSWDGVESALYRMGHGEKSIFWYWEINYELQCYRSFRSIDLAEGEKRFRKEDFDSWPKLGHEIGQERG